MTGESAKKSNRANLIAASALGVLVSSAALADDTGASGGAAPGAGVAGAALPQQIASVSGAAPSRGIPFEGWMLYPSLFVGATFDDNIYQTSASRASAVGARLAPNFEADLDTGLHKATIYGNADGQFFPGHNPSLGETASTVSGRTGFAYIWSPTSDLVTRFNVDYTRQDGPFGSALVTGAAVGSATSFVGAPVALNVNGFRQFTDQTTGNFSVQKSLSEQVFVRVGAGVQDLIYERPPAGITGELSGADYNAFVRGGFWLTPQLNAFVETGGDLRRYFATSLYDTNAYRVIGGLSSGMIGLFRGEVYGGFQQEFSARGLFGEQNAPAYGARLTYYPTQYLTVAASLDNMFGSAGAVAASSPTVSDSQTLQARLQADYAMFEYWKASVRGGFAETRYYGSSYSSEAWLAGVGASYNFWRNFALTLDYQFSRVDTNGLASGTNALSYSQNIVTAGVTYRY